MLSVSWSMVSFAALFVLPPFPFYSDAIETGRVSVQTGSSSGVRRKLNGSVYLRRSSRSVLTVFDADQGPAMRSMRVRLPG